MLREVQDLGRPLRALSRVKYADERFLMLISNTVQQHLHFSHNILAIASLKFGLSNFLEMI